MGRRLLGDEERPLRAGAAVDADRPDDPRRAWRDGLDTDGRCARPWRRWRRAGTGAGEAISAAQNQTPVPVHTMRLAGETIGEFVNTVIVPGLTFGWGPKGSKVIAYSATAAAVWS